MLLYPMFKLPPLSLYIHFPWCVRKCPYCDFNSHNLKNDLPEEAYIQCLLRDLEHDLQKIENRELVSIFMGGGTPSLFSPNAIEKLLVEIQKQIKFAPNIEITLEANPGTVEYQRFVGYRAAGVNRLSIGIQSFQAEKLTALGRIHQQQEAINAAKMAAEAGFTNFNLDLMHGLPDQTFDDAMFDLKTAIDLNPTHLSWYQLTLEPNTFFAKKPPVLPANELIWEMQDQGKALLAKHGFLQYEISAYSKPNKRCLHNENYWQFGDYLGIGAGAYSKITDLKHQNIIRAWKLKNPKDYLSAKKFIAEENIVTADELPFEFMLNALRLYQDISFELFAERTGLSGNVIKNNLDSACRKGLLIFDKEFIKPTELGRRFYNDLVTIFLND